MKRLLFLALALTALATPASAAAHPLGNFTVNRFSRVEVSGDRLYVRYVLDLAEIPTYQAGRIDPDAYARRLAAGLQLRVAGRAVRLRPLQTALAHPPGAGGLRTTRLEVVLAGPRLTGPGEVEYADTNYRDRIGWKEVVVGARTPSRSDELRAYPQDLLQSPLDVTSVSVRLAPGEGPARPPALSSGRALRAPDRVADGGFAGLVSHDLSLGFVLLSLALAMFWGSAHAFSPGHGKAIVAGYLVGTRGRPRDAFALGAIVTVTHTIGVFALGAVTLALSAFLVPEQLYPWLNLVSALLVVAVGIGVLRVRLRERRHARAHARGHDHHHDHEQGHGLRGLVGVGVSGGILPCPTALVVLLAAISLHRVGYGLVLVAAFSVGLAASVTGIGLVAVTARNAFARLRLDGRALRLLPAVSAAAVLALGLTMTLRALPGVV